MRRSKHTLRTSNEKEMNHHNHVATDKNDDYVQRLRQKLTHAKQKKNQPRDRKAEILNDMNSYYGDDMALGSKPKPREQVVQEIPSRNARRSRTPGRVRAEVLSTVTSIHDNDDLELPKRAEILDSITSIHGGDDDGLLSRSASRGKQRANIAGYTTRNNSGGTSPRAESLNSVTSIHGVDDDDPGEIVTIVSLRSRSGGRKTEILSNVTSIHGIDDDDPGEIVTIDSSLSGSKSDGRKAEILSNVSSIHGTDDGDLGEIPTIDSSRSRSKSGGRKAEILSNVTSIHANAEDDPREIVTIDLSRSKSKSGGRKAEIPSNATSIHGNDDDDLGEIPTIDSSRSRSKSGGRKAEIPSNVTSIHGNDDDLGAIKSSRSISKSGGRKAEILSNVSSIHGDNDDNNSGFATKLRSTLSNSRNGETPRYGMASVLQVDKKDDYQEPKPRGIITSNGKKAQILGDTVTSIHGGEENFEHEFATKGKTRAQVATNTTMHSNDRLDPCSPTSLRRKQAQVLSSVTSIHSSQEDDQKSRPKKAESLENVKSIHYHNDDEQQDYKTQEQVAVSTRRGFKNGRNDTIDTTTATANGNQQTIDNDRVSRIRQQLVQVMNDLDALGETSNERQLRSVRSNVLETFDKVGSLMNHTKETNRKRTIVQPIRQGLVQAIEALDSFCE